jgi:putative spermidine/putrescine transport system substrate-binding protein
MTDVIDVGVSRDLVEIAIEKLNSGAVDRRTILKTLGALGGLGLVGDGLMVRADAATGQLVISSFGGPETVAFRQGYGLPFEKETGLKVVIDGSGPRTAQIRAAVQARTVAWDVCDTSPLGTYVLGEGGSLETIDYTVVDKSKVLPGLALPHGVGNYLYSYVLAYDARRFPQPPRTWADLWDRKKFPGMRTMRKVSQGQMEAAVLAAGVPPDKLYPLDLELAVKKIKEIKSDVIFWESGQQSLQLFRDREVVMGNIWHHRAVPLFAELKDDFGWTWNQSHLCAGAWNIPKGNPAGVGTAMKFIASTQDPARQVEVFKIVGSGPVNPAASTLIPAELRKFDPGSPENLRVATHNDARWWADNYERANDAYLNAVSG